MKSTKKIVLALSVLAGCAILSGCGIGDAPSGMSETDTKAAIDKMKPEDKIKFIASSPLPEAEKQKRYADIEAKTGVKASSVLGKTGAPAPGGGTGGQ